MAISTGPRGLVPLRHMAGGVIRLQQYPITNSSTNYNTAIFNGDLVGIVAGLVQLNNGLSIASKSLGVLVGCTFTDPTTNWGGRRFAQYWPGSSAVNNPTDAMALVVDDPNAVFLISSDATNTVAATAVGKDANISTATAGSTVTGNSGVVLDGSTIATNTSTFPLRILAKYDVPNNNYGNASLLLQVTLNFGQHFLTQAVGAA